MKRPLLLLALCAALPLVPAAVGQDDPDAARRELWMVRVARMEGASVNVEEAAAELEATATRIADSGRIGGLSELVSDAAQLNRRVVSATLAAEVMDELDP